MPNKHNADRWRHIPKMRFQVTNWSAYEVGLQGTHDAHRGHQPKFERADQAQHVIPIDSVHD